MFPIAPLSPLPGAASGTDKNILAPKIIELIAAVNALDARLKALEPSVAPIRLDITTLQDAALDGAAEGTVVELRSPTMLTTLIISRPRVAIATVSQPPGVPVISPATTSINPAQIVEGSTTPVTGSIAVTNGGTGTLSGLAVSSVTYQQGSGWLTPTWDSGNSEVDWSINPTGLTNGTYSASFQITATNATAVTITAMVTIYVSAPGNFPSPMFSLPTFLAHDTADDDVDGVALTANAIGYYS